MIRFYYPYETTVHCHIVKTNRSRNGTNWGGYSCTMYLYMYTEQLYIMQRCDTAASNLILLAPLFTTTIANSQTYISRKSIPKHSVCRKHNMKLSQSAFFPNKGSVSRDFYLLFYSSVSNLLGPLLKRFTYVPVLWIRIRLQEFAITC